MARRSNQARLVPLGATSAETQITVREAVFSLLRGYGMRRVFGNPGSTELRFFRDWPADFDYQLALQESVAVAMADGYAQASRNAAFVNLHSAAGLGHAAGSVYTAYRNQSPLVITAGQQTRAMFPTEPYLYASDAAQYPKPYVKWSCEPARAQDVPAAISRAYHVAMQKPWGPVFVSIPEDDWDQPAEAVELRSVSQGLAPDPAALAELAAHLEEARAPVLVVGPAVDLDDAWDEAVALAERLEAPVWVSPLSARCSFPEDHRLFAGFLPPLRRQVLARLAGHDLILVLGAPVFTYHVHTEGAYLPEDSRLFHLTDDADHAARAPVGNSIRCTLKLGLQQLWQGIAERPRRAAKGRDPLPAPAASDPMTGEFVLHTLRQLMPADAVLIEEAPTHRNALHDFFPIKASGGFYAGASGGLGWALPAAVGVALAQPERKVVCLVGDGSSLYSIQALWSAAQHKLPITFIVMNNSGYSALKSFCDILGFAGAPGHDLPGVDFVDLARGFGCAALRVARPTQLANVLRRALRADAPTLVEVTLSQVTKRIY